jgi:NTE family protein
MVKRSHVLSQRRRVLTWLGLGSLPLAAGLFACVSGESSESSVTSQDRPRQAPVRQTYPLAWVLSSGGPRGFVHVGVLKALTELGLKPDLVVGSSVGALVGCLFAAGLDMAHIESLALQTNAASLFRLNLSGKGWVSAGGLVSLVNEAVGGKRIEQFVIPFAAVAADANSQQLVAFNAGNAGRAVQAACAVEGSLAAVPIGDRLFMDADLISPLPVRVATSLGAQRMLAVDASAHEQHAPPGTEQWRPADLRKRELTQVDANLAEYVLHPDTGYYAGIGRAYRERSIQVGYESTLQQAVALRALHQKSQHDRKN